MKNRWKNFEWMAYISYNKLWESEFDNTVSKKDKVQKINNNQLKLEVHDTFEKMNKCQQTFKLLMMQIL